MRPMLILGCALALAACERRGNLRVAGELRKGEKPAPTKHVENPYFDPYASTGDVKVDWRPIVADQRGTLFRPGG